MKQDGMYYKVTQEYRYLNARKRQLVQDRDKIDAQLGVIEGILIDLNDILCKHGNHIYEHFEESEPQESEVKMTLDEAIRYCEEEAERFEKTEKYRIIHTECGAGRYVEENKQLAAWLKELKDARNTLHAMYGRIGYL